MFYNRCVFYCFKKAQYLITENGTPKIIGLGKYLRCIICEIEINRGRIIEYVWVYDSERKRIILGHREG